MPFRVPLLFPVAIVLERVDITATEAAGRYHPVFRTPIQINSGGSVAEGSLYQAAVRVPVQFEIADEEQLRMAGLGDAPVSNEVYVAHRRDLLSLGLLEGGVFNGKPLISKNDRITAIEKNKWPGVVVRDLPEPLYILEVESGSPGMGPAGFDLAIIYVADRSKLDKA